MSSLFEEDLKLLPKITVDEYNTKNIYLGELDLTEAREDVREMGYKLSIFGTTSYIKRISIVSEEK